MRLLLLLLILFVSGLLFTPGQGSGQMAVFNEHLPVFYDNIFYPKLSNILPTHTKEALDIEFNAKPYLKCNQDKHRFK